MKTNNVKKHQAQPKQQETKTSANTVKASDQNNQHTSSKMDSSNKGKGPKGENL